MPLSLVKKQFKSESHLKAHEGHYNEDIFRKKERPSAKNDNLTFCHISNKGTLQIFPHFFERIYNMKKTRQIDLVLRYLANE